MEIPGYKYIAHKIISRPWGVECRFTVNKKGQADINDIVMLSDGKEDEKQISELIVSRLARVGVSLPGSEPERIYTKSEIENLLVTKGLLNIGQVLGDLKTKRELILATGVIK